MRATFEVDGKPTWFFGRVLGPHDDGPFSDAWQVAFDDGKVETLRADQLTLLGDDEAAERAAAQGLWRSHLDPAASAAAKASGAKRALDENMMGKNVNEVAAPEAKRAARAPLTVLP